MSWDESDLVLLPKRIQKQATKQLKTKPKNGLPETKKPRDNPEDRLVVDPTTQLCEMLGVWYVHIPPSKRIAKDGTYKHYTAYKGNTGLTDLILAKDGRSIFLECKAPGRKPSADQHKAMQQLGGFWADNPLDCEKVVLYVAGKAPMFAYRDDRKVL